MDNKILVNNIKKLCSDNNISISALEKEMYMSPGLISRWTKNTPAIDRVVEIAKYFHVSLDTLIGNASNEIENNNKNINRLLLGLYNKTHNVEIKWQIFNPKYAEDGLVNKKISSIISPKNADCFYCNVNGGNFILIVNYNDEEKDLSLYVLADPNSTPKAICYDNEKLNNIYDYLNKLYSEQLNDIKTNNFIDDFINQSNNSLSSNGKITVLKNVVNE
ncbi:MAG: helix-turn-helix transcriptional regulator [Lachnospiraceae bacterium]|nr:helix-turn-helix transcriptional regulator [Lachnospiraceae bacterium]